MPVIKPIYSSQKFQLLIKSEFHGRIVISDLQKKQKLEQLKCHVRCSKFKSTNRIALKSRGIRYEIQIDKSHLYHVILGIKFKCLVKNCTIGIKFAAQKWLSQNNRVSLETCRRNRKPSSNLLQNFRTIIPYEIQIDQPHSISGLSHNFNIISVW